MTQGDGLLQAMLEAPDDTSAKLVYADWLEEHGDPRAEFLRAQAELAAWQPDLERRTALQERERDWRAGHGADALLGPLARICSSWRYQGGLAHLTFDLKRFTTQRFGKSGVTWLWNAWAGRVRVEGAEGRALVEALAAAPGLNGVVALDLSHLGLEDEDVKLLLSSPHLRALRELDLCGNALTGPGLRALADLPAFARLTRLDARNNQVVGQSVKPLLRVVEKSGLKAFELHGNPLGKAGTDAWADWRRERPPGPNRFTNSLGIEMVRVPAGTFLMGNPDDEDHGEEDAAPRHKVTLTRPFYLGVFQVTQDQYRQLMGSNPAEHSNGPGSRPVEMVSWKSAVEFCKKLSALPAEKAAGRTYRLPTEAEWEHACRCGTTTPFWHGAPPSSSLVNYDGNYNYGGTPPGPYLGHPAAVGSYPPSPFGLYDTHGNVFEWVADYYAADYYKSSPEIDPPGPKRGSRRVCRGGSWDCVGWYCRSAHRHGDPSDHSDYQTGLRVACSL
jgi:uncharacterized protein (TIGR02996 family)